MPDRTRPIRKEICLNEQELKRSPPQDEASWGPATSAHARKMLIDGYIIKVDYTEQKKLALPLSAESPRTFNQICRRINSTGHCLR